MEISLVNDLQIFDAGTERNIRRVLQELNISTPDIILDFCNCGVDYPATSKILDKVLHDLSKMDHNKSLKIVFDFQITELALHKWFFIGSTFFEISEYDNSLTNEQFKEKLASKLKAFSITMSIEIRNDENEVSKTISYE